MNRRCPDRHYQMTKFKHWAYHHGWTCHLCCRYSVGFVLWGVQSTHYQQCHADYLRFGGGISG